MEVRLKDVRTELLGREPAQSRRALGIAALLFLLVGAVALVMQSRTILPGAFVYVTPTAVVVSLVVVLIGGVAAGSNAFRDGGLVGSWVLVLAPLIPWLSVYHYDPEHPFSTLVVATGLSLLTVPLVGTIAHAVGRVVQSRAVGDTWSDSSGPVLRFLIGTSPKRTGQWGLLAIVLLLGAVGGVVWDLFPVSLFFPFGAIDEAPLLGSGVTLVWVGVAAVPGYRREGLMSSWAVLFGPIFGGLVTDAATDQFRQLPLLVDAATAGMYALVLALIVSTVGFLLGILFRATASSLRGGERNAGA